jgi:hypothetical protein
MQDQKIRGATRMLGWVGMLATAGLAGMANVPGCAIRGRSSGLK